MSRNSEVIETSGKDFSVVIENGETVRGNYFDKTGEVKIDVKVRNVFEETYFKEDIITLKLSTLDQLVQKIKEFKKIQER